MINMTRTKTKMPEQDPQVRAKNFDEVTTGYTEEMAIHEAMRCLKCRKHPCMTEGCPVHNHIPDFIAKITEGQFEEAYQILKQTTTLPAVCGRVCPQYLQCEGSCVRAKKGQPVAIGALERFVADWHRNHKDKDAPRDITLNGYKVAVIGSGPASITCAGDLADLGYEITIFEKEEVLGGVLAYGIPEFRLPKEILELEVYSLKTKGVHFETGKALGKDFTLNDLLEKQGFNAVFIGNGAGKPMKLAIPGAELDGVVSAADYLSKINLENKLPESKKIAIIGGGNVAMDACRAAMRGPKAEKVYVIYRRSIAEMPADPSEVKEAMDEGIEFMYLTGPLEVIGENGKVTGLKCQKMFLSDPDESGRRSPVPVKDSEFVLDVDCIIEAIGNRSDNDCADGVKTSEGKGYIIVDDETYATSLKGVYAGGDTVTGPKTVISAMGAGKKAAIAIAEYLK
ncbi:MAG TPA: glutamate synthase (NADPH), homotetrameric [Eubacterium sp.]|jgi:glutamate synthase (NADPH/NADH) small chain|nr:glutamate synthase (NADPH), homotetrameric [Eubacterium sp.]